MGTYGEHMEVIWENDGTRMGKLWNNDGKIQDTYEKIMGTLWKGDGKSTTVQITFHGTWKSTMFHGNSILDDTTIQQLINKPGECNRATWVKLMESQNIMPKK